MNTIDRMPVGWRAVSAAGSLILFVLMGVWPVRAQLFDNLRSIAPRYPVGDPSITNTVRGPKGIVAADLDGNAWADFAVSDKNGSVTVYLSLGIDGFQPPIYLSVDTEELRAIVAGDVNRDGKTDLLTASPYSGQVHVLINKGGGLFEDLPFFAWKGVRDLVLGDFDGDGALDLAAAGPGIGLRQYQGLGDGRFGALASFQDLDGETCGGESDNFPQPAFFMHAFRARGWTRDGLVASHGEGCATLWVFSPEPTGVLRITSTLTNLDVNAVAVGAVRTLKSSGSLDLITASLDGGYVEVRPFNEAEGRFEAIPTQRVSIAGGPRSIRLVDWDRDGWNDLAVVQRFEDRVTLYNNADGTLEPGPRLTVGRLPRELDVADFTGDGQMDLAVVNRYSLDVTIIPGFPGKGSFAALDQVYPVEGTVSGLTVRDYNKDGLDDVAQVHIASGEVSVRLAGQEGILQEPRFYPMGFRPSAQTIEDVNNDGLSDLVAVDLGGSVSVRLGLAGGEFGPEQKLVLPAAQRGALFALVAADFNKDQILDLAVGYLDCRVLFLQGVGDGTFKLGAPWVLPMFFTYEARVMATADLDRDGDLDLIGAGMDGTIAVAENQGNFLTAQTLTITRHQSARLPELRSIQVLDENQDGDWDIFVSGPHGSALLLGEEGLGFRLLYADGIGTSSAQADFDGDGRSDLAVADGVSSTLSIFIRKTPGDPWELALVVSVPAGAFLAAGDLDGDRKPDLVGSGSVLWTALSSKRSRVVERGAEVEREAGVEGVVFNEFLASNETLPLAADGDRTSDWIELFNAAKTARDLTGWSLQLIREERPGRTTTNSFTFPVGQNLAPRTRLLLVANDRKRTPLHTGFNLPAEGATLQLVDASGRSSDRITFAEQDADRSFSRFRDGFNGWVVNPYPTPDSPNLDNGTLDPSVDFQGIDGSTLRPGVPIRFRAQGRDDLAITTMAVFWRRLDVPSDTDRRALLYDDGLHQDGASQDGFFSGTLDEGLPAGARIQFYLEVRDITDKAIFIPSRPDRSLATLDENLFTAVVGGARPTVEISEVVALNRNGLLDESGGRPDWVEIRNYGDQAVRFDGISLARTFSGDGGRFSFPGGYVLPAGEFLIVFCDAQNTPAAWHAPFALDATQDALFLTGTRDDGFRYLIDQVEISFMSADVALARDGIRGPWRMQLPTPRASNHSGARVTVVDGVPHLCLGTQIGEPYELQFTDSLFPAQWQRLIAGTGDGRDRNVRLPLTGLRFYRLKPN